MAAVSRRKVLQSIGLMGAGAVVKRISNIDVALAAQPNCGSNRRVMVSVFLDGGLHGPSLLVPRNVNSYHEAHPTLAITNSIPIDSRHGLNPIMTNFHSLLQQGRMNLMYGAGYPNHSQSHEEARVAIGRGTATNSLFSGWIGRHAEAYCPYDERLLLVSVGGGGSVDLLNYTVSPIDLHNGGYMDIPVNIDDFTTRDREYRNQMVEVIRSSGPAPASPDVAKMSQAWSVFDESRALVTQIVRNGSNNVAYPNTSIGADLRAAARLINSSVISVKHVVVRQVGYDTHGDQANLLPELLSALDAAIGAFMQDITIAGRRSDTLVNIWSEFGRTFENSSQGTDHGQGTTLCLIGDRLRPGVTAPQYEESDFIGRHWVDVKFDIREAQSQIIERHFMVDPGPVFPEEFNRIGLQLFT